MADAAAPLTSAAMPPTAPEWEGGPLERPALTPIAPGERIASIDLLRGVALLGILPMNILSGFALHTAAFFNPPVDGGFDAANRAVWLWTHLLFDTKMMAIFSMLFGTGLIVMDNRASARGAPLAGRYYRRLMWLALIGLGHAYLLWYGDILFLYAVCGMLLYPARRLPAWGLAALAAVLLPVPVLTFFGLGSLMAYQRSAAPAEWASTLAQFAPTPEAIAAETAARSGSYLDLLGWNARQSIGMHFFIIPLWGVWRATGLMLLGMALMKWGVFTAARSTRFYALLAAAGYGLGLPLVWAGAQRMEATGFDPVYVFRFGTAFNAAGSIGVALGHVAVVMLLARWGVLGAAGRAVAAVGRTALSNYLLQTAICLTLFTGLGLFSRLDRVGLMGVTAAIWLGQILLSAAWLRAGFLYGPAEWAWRSLTYGRAQPMRAPAAVGPAFPGRG